MCVCMCVCPFPLVKSPPYSLYFFLFPLGLFSGCSAGRDSRCRVSIFAALTGESGPGCLDRRRGGVVALAV
ncbi:uncharacterized protein P884DRAFT_254102 [Thermothelomyces heterothallicus CBS 202.75]|uniref:uncharacterized protein n=1 Tax=Thermothelomyces heterothallicus CBS 202.75 TaxID=1149848 RepID=UPI0037446451